MRHPAARAVASWVIVALLALAYAIVGLGKFGPDSAEMFGAWGYPGWFAIVIGVLELAGAVGLLVPKTTRYAIIGLTVIMLGAVYTHLANGETTDVARPGIFLALLWGVWWLRGSRSLPAPASAA